MRTVVFVLILVIAGSAAAQPEKKDPTSAIVLSVGGTFGGLMAMRVSRELGVVGLTLGPSLGRWYDEELGFAGAAVRFGAVVLVFDAQGDLDEHCGPPDLHDDCPPIPDREDRDARAERRLKLGYALWGAAALYDIVQSGFGAGRYNDAHHRVQVTPALVGRNTPGLALGFQW